MRRWTPALVTAGLATVAGILGVPNLLPAQVNTRAQVDQPIPPYNPYPPGILPADLQPELLRVRREIETIFNRYFAQWQALPPPTVTGNPPTLQGTGYDAVRILGGLMNYDESMSPF